MNPNDLKDNDCIFCQMVAGKTTADIVYATDTTLFIHDINPKAKVHVLGMPKKHITSLAKLTDQDEAIIGRLMHNISLVTADLDIKESGFRIIANTGEDAGQDVPHLHFHILGGEPLGPLRC
jgi:histidine triad (HIT) family protein